MTLVFAALLVVGVFIFTLFIRQKDVPEPLPVSPVQHLDDRKQAIYENLRDLQFEYRLGKLSDGDYQQTKQALQKELAGVLAETEAIMTRLGLQPAKAKRAPAQPAVKSATEPAPAASSCPHCGARFAQALKFCGECGKAMA